MRALAVLALLAAACATLAEPAGGDQNEPSAGVGPFRKLGGAEVRGVAPILLDDPKLDYREPSALPLDGSGQTTAVALYFVMHDATTSHDVLARSRATDGRTFFGATLDVGHRPKQVLAADQPWEGPDLAHPSALAVAGGIWLYYTSNGSVGLAKSTDGLTFAKTGAPVLAEDAAGPIESASVAQLPDGTFEMMYALGDSIWEATSSDGAQFTRAPGPVLGPAPPAVELAPGEVPPFDTLRVADPCVAPRTTPAGRLQIRVLYTGYAVGEGGTTSAIGFAARYGGSGALSRAGGAVYAIGKHERAPSLFAWQDGALLYVEQDSSDASYRVLGGAVAPATLTLPAPDEFPDSP